MRTITLFYDGGHYIYRWLKPMMAAHQEFNHLGYKVKFCGIKAFLPIFKSGENYNITSALRGGGGHDIVFLAFHHSTSALCLCPSEKRSQILQAIKKNCNCLVWLDTADSTGCLMADVLPFVDLYLKKQIYKDVNLYTKELYGARLFCDYYHEKLGSEDKELLTKRYPPVTDANYLAKVKLSWNVGLGDIFARGINLLLRPFGMEKPGFVAPQSSFKDLDIHFRGSGWSPIAGYQRAKCKELVGRLTNYSHPDVNTKIPYKEYLAEIKRAKAVISPFGWGEICTRDFEAFAYGATLLKPSMEHCVTWPDWYQAYKTYVPIRWDFSDYDDVISCLNSDEYKAIAKNGFDMYHWYRTSVEARREFAIHVVKSLT